MADKFIIHVSEHHALTGKRDPNFQNNNVKDNVWQSIAHHLC